MAVANDTVRGRIERARTELDSRQVALGLALIAGIGFALLFLQEPAAHEALHDYRHAAGVACH